MTELAIYEKDGLFHNVVKKSTIMNGRYVALSDGKDLNTNNVITHLEQVKSKYPIVVCTIPFSIIQVKGWEDFFFKMYFLCTSGYTGDNQFKNRDHLTNTSMHKTTFDVSDMKTVALSFMSVLEQIEMQTKGNLLRFKDKQPYKIERIINITGDKVSGVSLSFMMQAAVECLYNDVNVNDTTLAELFTSPLHESHKH